uniref:Uncharacterized protein n=1 Tax=Anguilla anguilla TaxID=7936 RepID=A0A0E9XVL6_ANGAN
MFHFFSSATFVGTREPTVFEKLHISMVPIPDLSWG